VVSCKGARGASVPRLGRTFAARTSRFDTLGSPLTRFRRGSQVAAIPENAIPGFIAVGHDRGWLTRSAPSATRIAYVLNGSLTCQHPSALSGSIMSSCVRPIPQNWSASISMYSD
jgi:hypothetical protein